MHQQLATQKATSNQVRKQKQRPAFKCAQNQVFEFAILIYRTSQGAKQQDDTLQPREPLLGCRLSVFFLLFVTLKSCCLTYKLIYKLHFSMNPFSLWLRPPRHFHRGQEFICKWNPEKCSPAPQRDRMPSHCSRSMGAAGIVGTAWPCSSRSTQSRSCLIQGLSPSMFLCSETSDNAKLPWQ